MKLFSIVAGLALLGSSVMSANLVKNGDFAAGTADWKLGQHGSAICSAEIVDGAYKVTIKDEGGLEWNVQITQIDVPLEKGKTYKVSFDAWSTQKRGFKLNIGENGGDYSNYSGNKFFAISKKKKNYSYEFTTSEEPKNARIEMNLGAYDFEQPEFEGVDTKGLDSEKPAPVFIDNVVLESK